jgi:tRNA threonylcarbamoyladenosine biosynthesis protein TsaB
LKLLGFDTATSSTTVALLDSDAGMSLERRDDPPPGARPRHTSQLLPLIVGLLQDAGWVWEELDRIAVGVGPGTFTGLRIGVATARALTQARGIALAGISTLESLSLNAVGSIDARAVCAVLDARRREVFGAAWAVGEPRQTLLTAAALSPGSLADRIADFEQPTLAIGDGAIAFRDVLERSGALIPDDDSDLHRVTAINHCRLGLLARASDADGVRPDYLRLPDAELARRSTTE